MGEQEEKERHLEGQRGTVAGLLRGGSVSLQGQSEKTGRGDVQRRRLHPEEIAGRGQGLVATIDALEGTCLLLSRQCHQGKKLLQVHLLVSLVAPRLFGDQGQLGSKSPRAGREESETQISGCTALTSQGSFRERTEVDEPEEASGGSCSEQTASIKC